MKLQPCLVFRYSRLVILVSVWALVFIFWQPALHSALHRAKPGPTLYFRQAHQMTGPYEPLVFVSATPIEHGTVSVQGMQGETVVHRNTLTYYPRRLYPFAADIEVRVNVRLQDQSNFEQEFTFKTADFSSRLWVEVDESKRPQQVTIWRGTQSLRTMICSTGKANAPTPEGVFYLRDRGKSFWSHKYQEGAYYWVRITGNYLFHSVPFDYNRKLRPEEASKLGTPASHGCIRLDLPDAQWFFENVPQGTYVIIRKERVSTTSTWFSQKGNDTLTIAMATDVVRLDPHDTSDNPSAIVNLHIFDTLFELSSSGEVKPSLAIAAFSRDHGKVWEVELRRGVAFQDGTPLTSKEVCTSFSRLLDPARMLARRGFFAQYISEVSTVDDFRLLFKLKQPMATFPFLLAHTSAAVVKETTPEGGSQILGTGPYKLQRWDPGYQVALGQSKYQWQERPAFQEIIFKIVPEGSSRAVLLETGMVDAAFPLTPIEAARLTNVHDVEVLSHPSQRIVYIGFNLTKPLFANPLLRQAFNYAVDKEAIITNLLGGLAESSGSPLAPSVAGYLAINPYPYDPDKANSLLAKAGIPQRPIQLWAPKGRYLQDAKVAEAVAGYLQNLGIAVELKLWEWSTYMGALDRNQPDWDLFLLGWVPATGEAYLGLAPLFSAESRSNLTFYVDPAVDALMQEALGCVNPEIRTKIYAQIQQTIHEAAPWIFLYAQEQTVGIRENLVGVEINPTEVVSFRQARRKK